MLTDVGERRRAGRRIPMPTEALSRARLRAGRELAVLNLSPLGMLVEGTARLLPGTHVDVHVTGAEGRSLVRARVVRSAVISVTADVVEYRSALGFGAQIDVTPADPVPALEEGLPA